nr:hypothetical protein [Anaerolineae bacterium]
MTQSRRLRLWFALALAAVLIAAALWLRGTLPGGTSSTSPILPPPHTPQEVSPLPTPPPPTPVSAAPLPSSWTGAGAALLWVALGVVLALGVAFVILRWYRRAA